MPASLLERVWEHREQVLYPSFFGDLGPGIYTIDPRTFSQVFKQEPDPRWLTIGVFASAPNEKHADWVYVTSGLSNPWESDEPPDDPSESSWLGLELVFRSTEGGDWAIVMLQRIAAFELLLAHGRYPGRNDLCAGDQIPLRAPVIPGGDSELTSLVVCPPAVEPQHFQLESGTVEVLQLVAASEAEVAWLREHGLEAFRALLVEHGAYNSTNPQRKSIV